MQYFDNMLVKLTRDFGKLKDYVSVLEKRLKEKNEYIDKLTTEVQEEKEVKKLNIKAQSLENFVSDFMEFHCILHLNEDIAEHKVLIELNKKAYDYKNLAKSIKGCHTL